MVTHFMGIDVAAMCVTGAGVCYFLGSAGVRTRTLHTTAAVLFLAAFGLMLSAAPERVSLLFAVQQCGLAVGLVGLAHHVAPSTRR